MIHVELDGIQSASESGVRVSIDPGEEIGGATVQGPVTVGTARVQLGNPDAAREGSQFGVFRNLSTAGQIVGIWNFRPGLGELVANAPVILYPGESFQFSLVNSDEWWAIASAAGAEVRVMMFQSD